MRNGEDGDVSSPCFSVSFGDNIMKTNKRLFAFLALLACLVTVPFAACQPMPNPPVDDPSQGEQPQGGGDNKNEQKEWEAGTLDDLVKNFWESETMYEESVLFRAETDAQGNVLSAPKCKLLYAANEILSLKHYKTNSDEPDIYTLDTDFTYSDGVLTAVGTLEKSNGKTVFTGTVPYVNDKALTGEELFPGVAASTAIPSTTKGLYLPFTEGSGIVAKQCLITYKHAVEWEGTKPSYYGDGALKKTVEKLKKGEKIELFVWGDSISTGANSSSVLGIAPNLPTWDKMLAANLSSYFKAEVNLTNKAVGGWSTREGVSGGSGWVGGKQIQQAGLSALLKNDLKDYVPDVALIGFGMNDAAGNIAADTFIENTLSMIATLRARNPECEIILIGTMLANPLASIHSKNQAELNEYLKRISKSGQYNTCTVDIGSMHADLLAAGKNYSEMTSNNVNHPNDFIARIYAMNLLSAFIEKENV